MSQSKTLHSINTVRETIYEHICSGTLRPHNCSTETLSVVASAYLQRFMVSDRWPERIAACLQVQDTEITPWDSVGLLARQDADSISK